MIYCAKIMVPSITIPGTKLGRILQYHFRIISGYN